MWVYGEAQWKSLFFPPTYSESVYTIFRCFVLLEDWACIIKSVMMGKASRLIFLRRKADLVCSLLVNELNTLTSCVLRHINVMGGLGLQILQLHTFIAWSEWWLGYRVLNWGFVIRLPQVKEYFFSSQKRPDRLVSPISSLFNGYKGIYSRGQSGRGVKLAILYHLMWKLRVSGTIPPLSCILPWFA